MAMATQQFKSRRDLAFELVDSGVAFAAASDFPHIPSPLSPRVLSLGAHCLCALRFDKQLTFDAVASPSRLGESLARAVKGLTGTELIPLTEKVAEGKRTLTIRDKIRASILKVLLIDVLVDKPDAMLEAIHAFSSKNIAITDVLTLIERGRERRHTLTQRHYNLHSVFTTGELLDQYMPIPGRQSV